MIDKCFELPFFLERRKQRMKKKILCLWGLFFCLMFTGCNQTGTPKYTVNFVDFDGTVLITQEVKENEPASPPGNPARTGYTFVGWNQDFSEITSDLTITALYEINQYTVTFVDDSGNVLKTETVSYLSSATPPTASPKEGYVFWGWDREYAEVTSDITVKAIYQKIKLSVKFVDYDGTILQEREVEYGDSLSPPSVPEREGYVFTGWDKPLENIQENLTITALYSPKFLTVLFLDYDGTLLKSETVEYGTSASAPAVEDREGYTFVGWDIDFTNVTKDLTVNACYEIKTFTVFFKDYEGNVYKEETVEFGGSIEAPKEPTRVGYKFLGWDKALTNIKSDLEVAPIYEPIVYQIIYKSNFFELKELSWVSKEEFVNEFYTDLFNWISENASKIAGLTKNGSTFSMTKSTRSATWSNVPELLAIDMYDFERTVGTLIYKPFQCLNDEPIIPEEDNNYFLNTEPYLTKYRNLDAYFLNCMVNRYTDYDRGYNQTSNGRVQIFFRFQQWAQNRASIPTLDTLPKKWMVIDNESVTLPIDYLSYTIEDELILSNATSTEAVFLGWFDNSLGAGLPITKIRGGTSGEITLYAKWDTDLTTHEVIFLNPDLKEIARSIITPGDQVTPPSVAVPSGYQFVGWDKDLSNITSDIVVTAQIQLIQYTITYHDTLGGIIDLPKEPSIYTILETLSIPDITLEGYLFLGWYDNPEFDGQVITKTTFGNLDLYPRFVQIPGPGETIGDGSIELVASEQTVPVERSTRIYAKANGSYLAPQALKFISTNPDLASIDETGFVCAYAVGEVVIIVVSELGYEAITISIVDESYQVKWVGHQGSGGPVVQNTVSAFLEGARRGYYAMECDVRVSSDGVYYICHDDVFKSTLFVDSSLWDKAMAPYTWNQLKTFQVKDTYGGQTYYGYLATVAEYLQICKESGAKAVLELKWTTGINSNDQSKLPGLVELVKQYGMYENAIFLSSMKNCLTFLKTHYLDANVQFLAGASTSTIENINWCIENQFSIDMTHDKVTKQFVDLMHDAYLYFNAYTVNYATDATRLQNLLVDMITTDNLGG